MLSKYRETEEHWYSIPNIKNNAYIIDDKMLNKLDKNNKEDDSKFIEYFDKSIKLFFENEIPDCAYKTHNIKELEKIKELSINLNCGKVYTVSIEQFFKNNYDIFKKIQRISLTNDTTSKRILKNILNINCKEFLIKNRTGNFNNLSNTIESIKFTSDYIVNINYVTNSIKDIHISCSKCYASSINNLPRITSFCFFIPTRRACVDYYSTSVKIRLPPTLKNFLMTNSTLYKNITIVNKKVVLDNMLVIDKIKIKTKNKKIKNMKITTNNNFKGSYKIDIMDFECENLYISFACNVVFLKNIKTNNLFFIQNVNGSLIFSDNIVATNISFCGLSEASYFKTIDYISEISELKTAEVEIGVYSKESKIKFINAVIAYKDKYKNNIKKLRLKIILDGNNLVKMKAKQLSSFKKEYAKSK
jgi:hypothetical protein